jgi:mRNA interferase RelE/StbE
VTFRIELRPAAVKALRSIPTPQTNRLRGAIALLATNPSPPGAKKLRTRDAYRVRVGDYRIIYTIEDDVLLIVVLALGHRQGTYGKYSRD